ncbi:unnamed protein product [Acanthocheilonema viteae]|uniref:Uncharacterized protein n=1 Tax=Acanthocheilonema viteae TaxID=6277 RepID=A0A498SQQ1_ACAVI|nr:unnamed protein product [Acanthocheilonema viteae]
MLHLQGHVSDSVAVVDDIVDIVAVVDIVEIDIAEVVVEVYIDVIVFGVDIVEVFEVGIGMIVGLVDTVETIAQIYHSNCKIVSSVLQKYFVPQVVHVHVDYSGII